MSRTYAADDFDFIREKMFENLGQTPPEKEILGGEEDEYLKIREFYLRIYQKGGWENREDGIAVAKRHNCKFAYSGHPGCFRNHSYECLRNGYCTNQFGQKAV